MNVLLLPGGGRTVARCDRCPLLLPLERRGLGEARDFILGANSQGLAMVSGPRPASCFNPELQPLKFYAAAERRFRRRGIRLAISSGLASDNHLDLDYVPPFSGHDRAPGQARLRHVCIVCGVTVTSCLPI